MSDHPDFVEADEQHRWTRPLVELGAMLRAAAWKAKGQWVTRVLPGGATVAMRMVEGGEDAFKREIRITRSAPLENFEQFKKWVAEIKVFRKHLDCERGWHTQTLAGGQTGDQFKPGSPAEWVTREDEALGRPVVEKVPLVCSKCGKPAEPGSDSYKDTICNKCALELGAAEQATLDLQQGDK